jgi:ABC-2 type transport system ATP-binding protein
MVNETAVFQQSALSFNAVSKTFVEGRRTIPALVNVTFRIGLGSISSLVGPDGAGKTTLIRLALGLLRPEQGDITLFDTSIASAPSYVQTVTGYMPQRFGLYEDLTVNENLDLYADLRGVPPAERPERYQGLMKMTNLQNFTSRLAGRLSGGMKQKLGLACTLLTSPKLLLLDEPTVGVDPISRRELWSIVSRLVEEEHITVLLSTAYLDEAERCDNIILLNEGRILDQGSPDSFTRGLKHRIFEVTSDINKRKLQQELQSAEGVLDAVIRGDLVRLVMREGYEPKKVKQISDLHGIQIDPVSPRFEDGYMAMLDAGKGRLNAQGVKLGTDAKETKDGIVITVDHIKRRFGDFYAVKDVSFQVFRGEVFGLLGANGAGKTTTFRMLCGMLPLSEGRLRVSGVDLHTAAAEARALVGYMSQKFSLYSSLSVIQNLRFFSSVYNLTGRRRKERIQWALDQLELAPVKDAASGELPLGYKQRLALSCALMHEPDILFLDEPTSGVDPLARREFWKHINALSNSGVTVLVTTHFMEEAEYCDRLAIMVDGEIPAIGTPLEIRTQAGAIARKPIVSMEEAFITLIRAQSKN